MGSLQVAGPDQVGTTSTIFIAQKQWKKVEGACENQDNVLIAEVYPLLDAKTGTIAVFVTKTTTKQLQAALREKQMSVEEGGAPSIRGEDPALSAVFSQEVFTCI